MFSGWTGLIAVLLTTVPGLVYGIRRERRTGYLDLSQSRELAVALTASTVFGLLALSMLYPASRYLIWTINYDELVADQASYFNTHYEKVLTWSIMWLGFASLLAYIAADPPPRLGTMIEERIPGLHKVVRRQPPVTRTSAWGLAFHPSSTEANNPWVRVGCQLSTGWYVDGWLLSASASLDEDEERDIVLSGPILLRVPGATSTTILKVSVLVVNASRIDYLTASYFDDPDLFDEVRHTA